MVNLVRTQLKKIGITDKSRIDEMFLRHNRDRTGYIDTNNLKNMCKQLHLPVDEDVLQAVGIGVFLPICCVLYDTST